MDCRSWLMEALTSNDFLMMSFVLLFKKLRAGSCDTDLLWFLGVVMFSWDVLLFWFCWFSFSSMMVGLMHFYIGLILVTLDVMILLITFLAWASLGFGGRIVFIFSLFSEFLIIRLRLFSSAWLLFGDRVSIFLFGSMTATGSTLLSSRLLRRVDAKPKILSLSKML